LTRVNLSALIWAFSSLTSGAVLELEWWNPYVTGPTAIAALLPSAAGSPTTTRGQNSLQSERTESVRSDPEQDNCSVSACPTFERVFARTERIQHQQAAHDRYILHEHQLLHLGIIGGHGPKAMKHQRNQHRE
jgi:hypothetical protein